MKSLSPAQHSYILSLLDAGQSACRNWSTPLYYIPSSLKALSPPSEILWGSPIKAFSCRCALCTTSYCITTRKAETAVQITKTLRGIKNMPLSSETVHWQLKKAGLKAVVKAKKPLLNKHHRREQLDFAIAHKDWTLEDWKHVVWSDEIKINCLGSDGRR